MKNGKVFKETEYSYRLKEVKMNKPHKDGEYLESLDYVYYCVFFEFFDCEGTKYRETFHCMGC